MRLLKPLGAIIFIAVSSGKSFNHRHVALLASCPNIHGCMICSGFLILDDIQPIGFSNAILGILALSNLDTNEIYEDRLMIKDITIRDLSELCDKLTQEIKEQDNTILELKGLLNFVKPDLLRLYEGELSPWCNNYKDENDM